LTKKGLAITEATLKQILLVRHGRTDWNILAKLNSFTDLALNPEGQRQAERLAQYLRTTYPFFEVLASPAQRAQQTAAAILGDRTGGVETVADAMEVDFGRFEGRTVAEIKGSPDRAVYEAWENGAQVEGLEGLADAGQRAGRVFQRMVETSSSETTILVTHGLLIRVLVCAHVLGASPTAFHRLVIDNASISTIAVTGRDFRLAGLNATHFLHSRSD
jgi:broad specificity phosphatase PhoE